MTSAQPELAAKAERGPLFRVLAVIILGVIVGGILTAALSFSNTSPAPSGMGCGSRSIACPFPGSNGELTGAGVILSAISVILLAALIVRHVRMFLRTRTRLMFALTAFLLALLVDAVLSSPLLLIDVGLNLTAQRLVTAGQAAMCVALAAFLYFTLE